MESVESVIKLLTPSERKIIPLLKSNKDINSIVKLSGLNETQVNRALLWLQDKKILRILEDLKEIAGLDINGKEYLREGLPERRFLNSVQIEPLSLNEIKEKACLNDDEIRISLGLLKRRDAIEIKDKVYLKEKGKILLKTEFAEERFLKRLPLELNKLTKEEAFVLSEIKKRRNIIKVEQTKLKTIIITSFGEEILKHDLNDNYIETLTTDMLKAGSWINKEFRHYNIYSTTPKIYGGRLHPLTLVINDVRKIFMNLGFKEMKSQWVDTAFWCMDSMWIPQDHPSREVQDTFYLPYKGSIPEKLSKKVAEVHEHGGNTGSKGYKYKWNPEIAKQLILRTHTTATTYRYFHSKNIKYPAKYFSIGRVFRNEAIDQTHLPEFYQVEGFVMDEGLNLRDLMGYIKEFYSKLGIHKIKFKPTYNPYTQPSVEASGYNEELGKWVELINSGIFRPESLEPYGIKVPVIAWGFGLERLAMMIYKKKDIRNLFGHNSDLNWLRSFNIKW